MTQDIQAAKRLILEYTAARDRALLGNETLQVCNFSLDIIVCWNLLDVGLLKWVI